MTAADNKATAEAQIRKLIDDQANAVRARDINGSMSSYAPDVVTFRCRESTAKNRVGCG